VLGLSRLVDVMHDAQRREPSARKPACSALSSGGGTGDPLGGSSARTADGPEIVVSGR
jgi:hypothetical protein